METIIMYQIPRSIMHDPLPHHVAHHFVICPLDRLLLPIALIEFTPPFPPLYAQLPPLIDHSLLCTITPTEFPPPLPPLIGHSLLPVCTMIEFTPPLSPW